MRAEGRYLVVHCTKDRPAAEEDHTHNLPVAVAAASRLMSIPLDTVILNTVPGRNLHHCKDWANHSRSLAVVAAERVEEVGIRCIRLEVWKSQISLRLRSSG